MAPMLKGIKHVAFSPNGKYLACSDMQDDHNLYIFDVKTKLKPGAVWAPIAYSKGTKAVVMSLGWNTASDVIIATCVKQVTFYSFLNNKLTAKNGSGWGVQQPADTVLSQATCGNTVFTGHLSGEIIAWNGSTVSKRNSCHKAKVNCLYANEAGTVLVSGGADGLVSTWKVEGA